MLSYVRSDVESKKGQQDAAVDITAWVNRAALDIIGIAALGVDFNALADPTNKLSRAYQAIFEPDSTSTIIFLLSILVTKWTVKLLPVKKARVIRAGSAYVKRYITEMMMQRAHESRDDRAARKDMLSVAAQHSDFSTDDLVNQARTFLVAGHETTATGVQWALYTLTRPENLHVQRRLRDEIHKQLPRLDSGEEISARTLNTELPYLDAVCKECLRINGPSPFSKRTAVRDTVLCGFAVRKGTSFVIPNWGINKSEKLWGESARVFDPQKWLDGDDALNGGADALAFQTFSSGTRGCIGKGKILRIHVVKRDRLIANDNPTSTGFALAEFKIMLAVLVGAFEITSAPDEKDLRIEWGIIARIRDGLKVNLKPVSAV
jgi:cytochrome P450